ncbi:hypothetical protein nvc1_088 [Namao virus]|nr:hypothetical protein nvc1_088 [Namao virus]
MADVCDYIVPQNDVGWIKSIGVMLKNISLYCQIKHEILHKAHYYYYHIYKYNKIFLSYSLNDIYNHTVSIVLHLLIKKDKFKIFNEIISDIEQRPQIFNKKFIINSIWNKYSLIENAGYFGSKESFILLIGLDVNYKKKNIHGEYIYEILKAGMWDSIKKNASDKIFIQQRYKECIDYLVEWELKKESINAADLEWKDQIFKFAKEFIN